MKKAPALAIDAEPYPFEFLPVECALLVIDMQRDFLEAGGFGEMQATMSPNCAAPSSPTGSCSLHGGARNFP